MWWDLLLHKLTGVSVSLCVHSFCPHFFGILLFARIYFLTNLFTHIHIATTDWLNKEENRRTERKKNMFLLVFFFPFFFFVFHHFYYQLDTWLRIEEETLFDRFFLTDFMIFIALVKRNNARICTHIFQNSFNTLISV